MADGQRGPIEAAVTAGDEREAVYQTLRKTAKLLDECESDRDARPLATTVVQLYDRLKELDKAAAARESRKASVLEQVMARYEARESACG